MKVHSTNLAFHMWYKLTILWNDLTIDWNDLTSNDLAMERNDRIPRTRPHFRTTILFHEACAANESC